jgi:hypothetical protein
VTGAETLTGRVDLFWGPTLRWLVPLFWLLLVAETLPVEACFNSPTVPAELVRRADVIVRARAIDTVTEPAMSPLDHPVTTVRFLVLEQVKGDERLFNLSVRGSLIADPDFNDGPVPYGLVRSHGRGGSCFAKTYQRGGEYLMILERTQGELTPYWLALSPTNEQIRGADDPWAVWVRRHVI